MTSSSDEVAHLEAQLQKVKAAEKAAAEAKRITEEKVVVEAKRVAEEKAAMKRVEEQRQAEVDGRGEGVG